MTDRIGVSYSSPATSFYLAADHIQSDNVNGRWLVRFYLRAVNGPGGSTSSQYNGSGVQVGYYNGTEFGRHSGSPFLPSGYSNGSTRWNNGPWDVWIYGRSAWNMPVQMLVQYGSINQTLSGSIYLPALPNVPNTPPAPSFSEVSPTGMKVSWSIPSDGGSAIDQMLLRRSLTSDFASYTDIPLSGSTTSYTASGLVPQTTYYWRLYAHNAVGYSGYSSGSQSTLPSTAPGLTVTPTVPGTGATAALTPPGGATGVTSYRLERRAAGTTSPVTTVDSSSNTISITGLTPGATYEYRASAFFGTYQSPFTAWTPVIQPNPNTDPGSYFDGSTPDTPVLDYGWVGTSGLSVSRATGKQPVSWKTFAQSAATSGGTGAVFQSSGGRQGAFSARALFFSDTTAYGFAFGTADGPATAGLADVEGSATYFGSIYAYPSRIQRLRAVIVWWTSAGTFISSSAGDSSVVDPTGSRLIVSAVSPSNAQWASIVVENVAGASGSLWLGGDWLQLDAAMITLQALFPYFDGDTPDTSAFRYDWTGTPNSSSSTRTTLQQSQIDPLLDPDCPPPPTPPKAPVVVDDCVDEVGIWRRYWAIIPESSISDTVTMLPTIHVTTGGSDARQVRVRIYENPLNETPDQFDASIWDSEQIISYMPAMTTMTLDGVEQRVYAQVASGALLPADKLLFGTGGTPATWPTLSCGVGYLLSFDVPLEAPAGNVTVGIDLTRRVS